METQLPLLRKAITLIEEEEDVRTEAYLDPIGIPTICAGITRYPSGTKVQMGDICSRPVCEALLIDLLDKEYLPRLEHIPGWRQLSENQQLALISFAWNNGANFYGAKGYETISAVLKAGAENPVEYGRMREAFMLYVYAGGEPMLAPRRKREADLWDLDMTDTLRFVARQDTRLKVVPIDSEYLSEKGRREVAADTVIEVSRFVEIPEDPHDWVVLSDGSRWAIFGPHWIRQQAQPGRSKIVDWTNFSAPLSSYLSVGEVLRYDARRRPVGGSVEEKNLIALATEFDKIRAAWGSAIAVTSGHRPEPVNREVGGVPNSYHTRGMALDIYPVNGRLENFHQWLKQRWSGGYGDGRRKGFIHIDTRNGGKFYPRGGVNPAVIWDY